MRRHLGDDALRQPLRLRPRCFERLLREGSAAHRVARDHHAVARTDHGEALLLSLLQPCCPRLHLLLAVHSGFWEGVTHGHTCVRESERESGVCTIRRCSVWELIMQYDAIAAELTRLQVAPPREGTVNCEEVACAEGRHSSSLAGCSSSTDREDGKGGAQRLLPRGGHVAAVDMEVG